MKDSLCLVVNRSTPGCRITDSWVCSDVLITLIICITILLIVGCIAYCYYKYNRHEQKFAEEKYKKRGNGQESTNSADASSQTKNGADSSQTKTAEDKERKEFINFCYEMVRSDKEVLDGVRNDCWAFLKKTYMTESNSENAQSNQNDVQA